MVRKLRGFGVGKALRPPGRAALLGLVVWQMLIVGGCSSERLGKSKHRVESKRNTGPLHSDPNVQPLFAPPSSGSQTTAVASPSYMARMADGAKLRTALAISKRDQVTLDESAGIAALIKASSKFVCGPVISVAVSQGSMEGVSFPKTTVTIGAAEVETARSSTLATREFWFFGTRYGTNPQFTSATPYLKNGYTVCVLLAKAGSGFTLAGEGAVFSYSRTTRTVKVASFTVELSKMGAVIASFYAGK